MNINKKNSNIFLEPIFSKKDTLLSYRSLNHYDELGLLLSNRETVRQWRKFNAYELIWINLVSALRDIGVSLTKLIIIKNKIINEGKEGSIDKANFINKSFNEEILLSVQEKYELYLLIFSDCSYTFQDSLSMQQWHNGIYKNEPHINIPITSIIKEVQEKLASKLLE